MPEYGSRARTVTSALSPLTIAAPTAGAGFRYHDLPHVGHVTPPLGRGSPSLVPSAGQKRKGSVGEKGMPAAFSALTRGP